MNARTLPACPDKIADKPALLAGLLLQRDAEIRELVEALRFAWDELSIARERLLFFGKSTAALDLAIDTRLSGILAKHKEVA